MSQIIVKDALEGIGSTADSAIQVVMKFSRRGTMLRIGNPGSVTNPTTFKTVQLSSGHQISNAARLLSCAVNNYLAQTGRTK